MALHFLYGEESTLIENKLNELKKTVSTESLDLFKETINLLELEQCIQTQDMFNPQKLILIQNPDFLTKTLTDKNLEKLKSIFKTAKTSPHTTIIFMLEKSIDGRKKTVSMLKKSAISEEFKVFKDWEQDKVHKWIKKNIESYEKKIDQNALYALEQTVGLNLRELASTIQTLLTYIGNNESITQKDVENLCSRGTSSAFKLTEAMQKNDTKAIIQSIAALLDAGEDPIKLFGLITANIRLFTQILLADAEDQSQANMAKSLGKNPYYLKRLIPTIKKHHTLPQCKNLYKKLAETDLAIKTGKIKPNLALQIIF